MIANVAQTVLGLWLVYTAVLNPWLVENFFRPLAVGAGVAVVLLSLLARRSDYHPWHGNVTIVLGTALFLIGAWDYVVPAGAIVNHWILFWVGVLSAFVALWAFLYKKEASLADR